MREMKSRGKEKWVVIRRTLEEKETEERKGGNVRPLG